MFHSCRQGHAGNDAVQRQTERGTAPSKIVAVAMRAVMARFVVAGDFSFFDFVMMKAKKSLDEKHGHQSQQQPQHHC